MSKLDRLWNEVLDYFAADQHRIDHARRVLRYAMWILEGEETRGTDRETVRAVAMVHDIGIPEAERKYGSAAGPYQELEGPPVARRLLQRAGFAEPLIDHVCRIVASHHSPGEVQTPEFNVLWDADWLVNLPDEFPGMPSERLAKVVRRVFKTPLGGLLARRMFLHEAEPPLVLVSACLVGQKCRYNGGDCRVDGLTHQVGEVGQLLRPSDGTDWAVVPVCPERLGGLPTPREPAEIAGGSGGDVLDGHARVVTARGEDVTEPFVVGAREALELARALGVHRAVLKEASPSCGSTLIYDGTFTRTRVPGEGLLAALLRRHGFTVTAAG